MRLRNPEVVVIDGIPYPQSLGRSQRRSARYRRKPVFIYVMHIDQRPRRAARQR